MPKKKQDLFAHHDTLAGVTRDIHDACAGMEVSVLWDKGKLGKVGGAHTVNEFINTAPVEKGMEQLVRFVGRVWAYK